MRKENGSVAVVWAGKNGRAQFIDRIKVRTLGPMFHVIFYCSAIGSDRERSYSARVQITQN